MTRESSESLASTKLSSINSGNRKGGNSCYFQTGSVVRPSIFPRARPSEILDSRSRCPRLCPLVQCFPTGFPDDCGVLWVNQADIVRCFDNSVGVLYWTCSKKLSVGP